MINTVLKLIKLEYLKYKSNNVVLILLAIFTIAMPSLIFMGKKVLKDAGPPIPSVATFYEFPGIWDYQGYVGNWCVSLILGFMVIYMFTIEVSNKTFRQSLINGLTRQEIVISKIAIILIVSIYATLLYYISALIIGFIHTDLYDMELVFDNNFAGLRYFIMCVGYLSFAMLVATLVRSSALSLMLYMGYILMIEMIGRLILVFYYKIRWPNFAPLNAIEDTMPNPLMRIPDFFSQNEFKFSFLLTYSEAIVSSLLYISIFVLLIRQMLLKRDM